MDNTMPILLVPGLASSFRIYAPVIPALWRFGPVTVANHIRDDNMGAIARRILAEAPERVAKRALINTQARPDTPEISARRREMIARARDSEPQGILDEMFPLLVHPSRAGDVTLRKIVQDMGDDIGAEGFINNQTAIIARADSRPTMAAIKCPTLVLTSDQDQLIPNSLSKEMAEGIPGARLIVTLDCGHCPQLEQPLATADALVEWLRI